MCELNRILREPVNTVSHAAGAIASIAGLSVLVAMSAANASVWHVVSFSIFGSTLVLMYTSSSLYHGLKVSPSLLTIFRRIDHVMIYLLIAGSYTPFCLVPMRGAWGWSLFGVIWGLAAAGSVIKISGVNVPRWVSTLLYLLMGWLCITAVYPLATHLQPGGLAWLVSGGLFYSVGAVIYSVKKPNLVPGIFGFHEIWHLFVMAGSFCHFWAVFKYVMVL
ncbi:MAG: hemolysin III family protein [Desulfobacteraceae bacterium]